jgi:hypothetical protein
LPNLETINVRTNEITAHLQDKNIPSISNKDADAIAKCTSLKNLSIINQAKMNYLDVSNLQELQTLEITHNQNLTDIYGIDKINNLWDLSCFGNNRLFEIPVLDKALLNNKNLGELNLDVLLFPNAINYNTNTGMYSQEALNFMKKISNEGTVKWCESLNGNRSIQIYHNQMIELHNKACEILSNNIPENASDKDTIVGIENYLSQNVKYDYDGLKNGSTNASSMEINGSTVRVQNGPMNGIYGSYNALMLNTCVCEGYTRGMQYLLKLRNINSHNVDCYGEKDVTGMADGKKETIYTQYKMPDASEYHSIICIDDYYGLYDDPCWNAYSYQNGDKSMPWVLRTKKEISEDHTLSFDERDVSNNHLLQSKQSIEDSIKSMELFKKARIPSINATKNKIAENVKGQIREDGKSR